MKIEFESKDEWDELFYAVRNSNILWRKRRMECQGKINLQEDGSPGQFSLEECEEGMAVAKKLEDLLESLAPPEWP
jgi:hypothetical protein